MLINWPTKGCNSQRSKEDEMINKDEQRVEGIDEIDMSKSAPTMVRLEEW
jgi:hypothetical protein